MQARGHRSQERLFCPLYVDRQVFLSSLTVSSALSQFLVLGDFQSFSCVLQLYKVLTEVGFLVM